MRWRDWWLLTATSYTCTVVCYAAFAGMEIAPSMTAGTLLGTFVLCATLSLVQLAWGVLSPLPRLRCSPRAALVLDALCRCLLCVALVLAEGMGFGFVPRSWRSVGLILPILIPVFLVVYFVMYCSYRRASRDADFINGKIRGRR